MERYGNDWNDPAQQATLRVGTVLEARDGGHLRVQAITAEGIVCRGGSVPRCRWSWRELTRLGAYIAMQPTEADGSDTLPWDIVARLTQHALQFEPDEAAPGPDAPVARYLRALGSRLLEAAAADGAPLRLDAVAPRGHPFDADAPLQLGLRRADGTAVEVTAPVAAAVAALRRHMLVCQGYTWRTAEIGLGRPRDRWSINAEFRYDYDEAPDGA